MNRTEKTTVVESLTERFKATPHVILADYKGLTAGQATELRRKIRVVGGTYMVLKNRLARRGAEGTAVAKIADRLKGTCGLAAHASDPVALAKVVSEFSKDNPQLRLVACVVDAKEVYGAEGIKTAGDAPGPAGVARPAVGPHQHAGDPARPARSTRRPARWRGPWTPGARSSKAGRSSLVSLFKKRTAVTAGSNGGFGPWLTCSRLLRT